MSEQQENSERTDANGRYIVFQLGREQYALSIENVLEIASIPDITELPSAPRYVDGVINLRGKIVPVVDLRARMGMARAAHTPESCIVICEHGRAIVGFVVDNVCEVEQFAAGSIEQPPDFGNVGRSLLRGIAKTEDRVRLVLSVRRMFEDPELKTSIAPSEDK
jgi:purine-binding chemotaxis protein CheW